MTTIHAYVMLCMLLNSYQCISVEVVREDYTYSTTVLDCMKGGIIAGTTMIVRRDAADWYVKGVRCKEGRESSALGDYLAEKVRP